MDSTRHAGRTVVISGAAHGIGAATAERLYREGASLVLADINQSGLDAFASSFDDTTRIASQVVDVGEEDQLLAMIDRAITAFGKLDVLINNAGAGVMGTVTELSPSDWRRVMTIGLDSVYLASRAAIPHLRATHGCIVNTASICGLFADYGLVAYCTAKAGVVNLTRNMAIDHASDGIRVNSVCPGPVNTHPGGPMDDPLLKPHYQHCIPMGRVGLPHEIASVIAFLSSDDASYVTGHNLVVDGGLTAHSGQPNFTRLYGDNRQANEAFYGASKD